MRRIGLTIATALLPLLAMGCSTFRLDAPTGFAEVSSYDDSAHYKANNNVGLKVNVFENVEGGTLAFWARDMVEKLGQRGYTLESQAPAKSKNGVVGTRFDFSYTPIGKNEGPRFYTAVLFVTDEYRAVLQVAGQQAHKARYSAEVDTIAGDLKVRGCKVITKACKGPQPERLSTPAPAATEGSDEPAKAEPAKAEPAKAEPAKAEPAKAEPEAEPAG